MGDIWLYRFMAKVQIVDGPIPGSPCWLWLGAKSRGTGMNAWYGSFKLEGKAIRAHRFSSEYIRKQICPKGWERHHTCENTLCVCPEHVEVVTKQVNLHERWKHGEYRIEDYPPPF